MPRPTTHRTQQHDKCCETCRHARLVACKLDLLCFHGDAIEVVGQCEYPVTADDVLLDGEHVGYMDGEEYSPIWADRIVDGDDVCDQWEGELPPPTHDRINTPAYTLAPHASGAKADDND